MRPPLPKDDLLRAHILTCATLRRLADITDAAEIHLWLVAHTERLPGPIAQLLEGLPHDTSELDRLLEQTPDLTDDHDDVDELPAGAGLEFPDLQYISAHDGRPRSAITGSLSRPQRATVHDAWDQAHAWMTRWIDEHPDATYQQSADAAYLLARHGDSASEIYTRIRAALDASTRAGEATDVRNVDSVLHWSIGEIRPFEFNAATACAAALADQTADPQHAALIALAAVIRCPRYVRALDHHTVAADGSRLYGPWGGLFAIPSELRRFIATQHERLQSRVNRGGALAFLPGTAFGRMSQPSIRRALPTSTPPLCSGTTRPAPPSEKAPTRTVARSCTPSPRGTSGYDNGRNSAGTCGCAILCVVGFWSQRQIQEAELRYHAPHGGRSASSASRTMR